MLKLIKWLFILAVLGFIALALYAYVGPLVGVNFDPQQTEIKQEIQLDTQ